MTAAVFVTGVIGSLDCPMRAFYSREDAALDSERFAPPGTVREFAPIERHPGSEPPTDGRDVLCRFGKHWDVAFYASGYWWRSTLNSERSDESPDEWIELPESRER